MFVAGGSKIGKSFVCLEFCRALALGDNPFECPLLDVPRPTRTLYCEAEVKEQGVQSRGIPIFEGVNRDYLNENLFLLTDVPEMQFDQPKGFTLLRQALDSVQPEVLILDPLGRFIGGADENSNSEMNKILTGLDQILKDYRRNEMAVIIAHHTKKPNKMDQEFDPLDPYEMRGSSRFYANPDSIFMLSRFGDYVNKDQKRAWRLNGRIITRQAESMEDFEFTVNDESDLRVRFVPKKGPAPKLTAAPLKKTEGPAQMSFREG